MDRRCRRGLVFSICLVALLAGAGGISHAQNSCSGTISPSVVTTGPYFVGETVRVQLQIGVATIQGGTMITIPEVLHRLDCFNGGVLEMCADEGTIVSFQGGVTTTCATTWNAAVSGSDPNLLVFDAVPNLQLLPKTSCNLQFNVRVEQTGLDGSPNVVQSASGFNGACDNGLTSSARGTSAFLLGVCAVRLDKQVSCDGGATWQDVGFNDGTAVGCDSGDGATVLIRYLANSLSNVTLVDCAVSDSNTAILPAPVGVSNLPPAFNGQIFQTGPLTCTDGGLDLLEPDTGSLDCECRNDGSGRFAQGQDQADFDCIDCETPTLDKEVSCDGGATWVEDCDALEGTDVLVRYSVTNGSQPLDDCVITDSNGAVLPGGENIGPIAAGFSGVVLTTSPIECIDGVADLAEPDTATLVCDCSVGDDTSQVSDTDTANFDCIECDDPTLNKEVSCDGGATWVEDCAALHGTDVLVRYSVINGDRPLDNCVITDSNGAVLPAAENIGPIAAGFSGVVLTTSPIECIDGVADLAEPDTATLVCDCTVGDDTSEVSDTDTANFDCIECEEPTLDKEVSCDSGATWVEDCDALDGTDVLVRYRVINGDRPLDNCVITDSNGAVLPGGQNVGPIAPGFKGVVLTTSPIECIDGATDLGEPDTATLACDCTVGDDTTQVTDTDTANFDCIECDVAVDKQVSCDGGVTWNDTGFDDGAVEGCESLLDSSVLVRVIVQAPPTLPLDNCVLTDSSGAVLPAPQPLNQPVPAGQQVVVQLAPVTCDAAADALEPDTMTVTCDCAVGNDTSEVEDQDSATFDCIACEDPVLDKEVSCDGGATWVEACDALDGTSVLVRYSVTNGAQPLDDCVITDSNGVVLPGAQNIGPIAAGFSGVVLTTSPIECIDGVADLAEPDTATLTCDCTIGDDTSQVSDTDTANFDCIECDDPTLNKEVSCDGGATWVEDCDALDGTSVLVRYSVINGDRPLDNCVITDSNGAVLPAAENIGPIAAGFSGAVLTTSPIECIDGVADLAEPDTATLTCDCTIGDDTSQVSDTDTANFDCIECVDPTLNKEVSCDGGATWVEDCDALDGTSVLVRYSVINGSRPLDNCVITDSNGAVLPAAENIGPIAAGFSGAVLTTSPIECIDGVADLAEPDTATLTCDCTIGDDTSQVSDTDTANFDCIECVDPTLNKEVSCDGGATWVEDCDAVDGTSVLVRYSVINGSRPLDNCVITDSNGAVLPAAENIGPIAAGFSGAVLTTSPIECVDGVADLAEPDTATLTCDCTIGDDTSQVSDTDTANFDCIECEEPTLNKEVSCDGGATWVEDCDALDGTGVLVRYSVTNGSQPLDNCVITDSNGAVLPAAANVGPFAPGFSGVVLTTSPIECIDGVADLAEPDTATLTCDCTIGDDTSQVSDTDTANFDCIECEEPTLNKEVSCDGGATWVEDCDALDGTGVLVRYSVTNGSQPLDNCVITDSNGAVLPAAANVGPFAPGFSGVVLTTSPIECIDGVADLAEPDTATLTCDCTIGDDTSQVSDTDTANFDCIECDEPTLNKEVTCDDGATWVEDCNALAGTDIQVRYSVINGSRPLDNCVITDSNGSVLPGAEAIGPIQAGFSGVVFTASSIECIDGTTDLAEPDTATLVCDCTVGDDTTQVTDTDTANFDCIPCSEPTIDKEVSCNGGATWVEDCDAPQGTDVLVRYSVTNGSRPLDNCVLTDSNGAVLPAAQNIGPLAAGFSGVVFTTSPIECINGETDVAEPDTATLVCDCTVDNDTTQVTATDTANFDCTGGCTAGDCDDGNPCTDDKCNQATGLCVYTPDNTNTCGPSDACTARACVAGQCVTTTTDCNDNNCCTIDTCHPVTGCSHAPNTTPPVIVTQPNLSDGDACAFLWPPQHGYVDFDVADTGIVATDACGPVTFAFGACTSSQPENTTGDGNSTRDCVYEPNGLHLRAERRGDCSPLGRVYGSAVAATNSCGVSVTSQFFTVCVWHDRRDPPPPGSTIYHANPGSNQVDTRPGTNGTYGPGCGPGCGDVCGVGSFAGTEPGDLDWDRDGVSVMLDNCGDVSNSAQINSDASEEGDSCDASDALVDNVRFYSPVDLSWAAEGGSTSYHVYRGDFPVVDFDTLDCFAMTDDLGTVDLDEPDPGRGFFYVVVTVIQGHEGSPGSSSEGLERGLTATCP